MASEEILIVGSGFAGLSTAAALSESGIASTVIEDSSNLGGMLAHLRKLRQTETEPRNIIGELLKKIESSGKVKLLKQTRLVTASGVARDFLCHLRTGDSVSTQSFGAIVLATGSIIQTPIDLPPLDRIEDVPADAKCVCIVLAPGGASSPVQTEMALDGVLSLRDKGVEAVVLYQQMCVAGAGLQSLYDEARASGVVFGRYARYPEIEQSNGTFKANFTAEDLAEHVCLTCDAVFSEGEEQPSPGAQDLARILEIGTDKAGFFQSENVSLYPVATRRRGIFVVGSCRKPAPIDEVVSDSYCAASQIRELLAVLREGPPVEAPVVDTEKCAFCLTCFRACPHRAIGFDFENRAAKILENACYACGICVVECPARAIKFKDADKEKPAKQVRIAGFFCTHSAVEAFTKLKEKNLDVPEIAVTEVECSGAVEIPDVLEAFERGADGVVIAGCHKRSCRSLTGSHYAEKRSERIKAIMQQVALQPEKIEMLFVSNIEPSELARALCKFAERIERIRRGE